ncbi:M3 family oligoendopeptidase [Archangium violaceum]|nr:M3 family oligoendopeptidase [Archangium violaceum]
MFVRSSSRFFLKRASVFPLLAVLGCASGQPHVQAGAAPAEARPMKQTADLSALKAELVARHGEAQRARIERGVDQVAVLWRAEDGDLAAFVREYFIADEKQLEATLARLETAFEQLDGHLNEISRELRRPTDLDLGPLLPVDPLLAAYDPGAHTTEDLFQAKVGFVALLNFPLTTLAERMEKGPGYTRRQWAEARLTGRFSRRVPAEVRQASTRATADADLYIAEYNIWMHHLVDEQGRRPFPKGMRLISHWNLRDELKSRYADPEGVAKQRMIIKVMERIVTQTIPAAVIDNPWVDWNPFTNEVKAAPAGELESDAPQRPVVLDGKREDDVRYTKLLAQFHAARREDPYVPVAPTAIARSFELGRELPEARVKALLEQVLTSPLVPQVAKLIEQRLGRKLEPQDLWYAGFRANAKLPEAELDKLTRQRYPTAEAFAKDLPRILQGLGFSKEKAAFLSEHIRVDSSRGAGHAMPSLRRGDFPRLRTRVGPSGMDYKGYNIAVHELGHNVEQVFSLYEVDHTLLAGVPNNAFTEALAFVFQARDLELLGQAKPDAARERERVLNDFWQTWEIAGVALVDIAVWHWMYEHPDATPAQLREAVVRIAQETWDRYYAPVLGGQGTPLLGIYSHMISYPLYLTDYPLGHLIAFQIEEHLHKAGKLGAEFERMASQGALTPDVWMTNATGAPVSAEPLLRATEAALLGR